MRDEIHTKALEAGLRSLDADQLAEKRVAYASIKQDGLAGIDGVTVLRDYENLPSSFVRVADAAALNSLIARPEVKAVYENRQAQHGLAQSLPLIEQPAAAAAGLGGAGTTVAVLDTGVDFTIAPFNCTSPGIPAGCRVVDTFEAAPNDFVLDDPGNPHGTNVSGIVASTAGSTDLVVADVFDGSGASFSDIEAGVNWAIAIQSTFNIVAMNLSIQVLSLRYSSPCTTDFFATPMAEALAAGIQPIGITGNGAYVDGVFGDGITTPACTPAAVRVGGVYDSNLGSRLWNVNGPQYECTDSTTAADKVTCFSQSGSYISLLAPAADVTAAGLSYWGTSQAAPIVAGAWAMMRGVSDLSEGTLLETLQSIGDPILDTRPSPDRTTSRLDLLPEPAFLSQIIAGAVTLAVLRLGRSRRN